MSQALLVLWFSLLLVAWRASMKSAALVTFAALGERMYVNLQ